MSWFLRRLAGTGVTVIRVKSWVPSIEIGWPTMLVERHGSRMTITPIWDWAQIRSILGFSKVPEPAPRMSDTSSNITQTRPDTGM